MKVYIYRHDPLLTLCYLPNEAVELFGEDALDDCPDVPDDLAKEINDTYEKLKKLSRELEKYR